MKNIYFITSNENKFKEIKQIIPNLIMLNIDLTEIQEIDPQKVIKAKLKEAFRHTDKPNLMVEDTSLYMNALNGLPGTLIKWYLQKLGVDGLYQVAHKFDNYDAQVKTIIGFAENQNNIHFFEGILNGTIVQPKGNLGFGFDVIFQPNGFSKTLGEMSLNEKNRISMRKIAAQKLRMYLKSIY